MSEEQLLAWRRHRLPSLIVLVLGCVPLPVVSTAQNRLSLDAVDLDAPLSLDRLAGQLATKRVIFVGEIHNRYDNHLNQLEIIRRLHQVEPELAIGVEYFEQRVQPHIDDYIAGKISEEEFLRATDYFEEWGYDYRLYAPIFRFARNERITVRALNVPVSLPSAVARVGLDGLSREQRRELPADIEPAGDAYKSRLREAFEMHTSKPSDTFDHFVQAQLVWDESMAASAAAWLNANPGRHMVILAGAGHLEFGSGIPMRLARRTHATYAIVLSSGEEVEPHIADYVLLSTNQKLPPAGDLGASLQEKEGECRILSLDREGAAEKAGMRKGDVLVRIDGQSIKSIADVRLALWDKKPGDRVRIGVRRSSLLGSAAAHDLDVDLTSSCAAGDERRIVALAACK